MLVIGVDGATWKVINPNIDELKNFKKLVSEGYAGTIRLKYKPISPAIWCSMFSGVHPDEHGHYEFVRNGRIVKREDINVEFIWDILSKSGISVKALNVPFVVPPYNYNVDFNPPYYGLPIEENELLEEIKLVTEKSLEILTTDKPSLFIVVYTALDRLSHLHWGEPILLDFYKLIDDAIGKLIKFDEEVIIVSDHGFCDYDEAPVRTLPRKTPRGEIKGDHHPDAIVITKNIDCKIKDPVDVFYCIKRRFLS